MKGATAKFICGFVLVASLHAETPLIADFRHEGDHLKACGDLKSIFGCVSTLFTDHPLHISAGSIAPGNGLAAGGAFVTHWTPGESWTLNADADAVASVNGSWRAGGYLTAVFTPRRTIVARPGGSPRKSNLAVKESLVMHGYAQSTSLSKLAYFGLGPDTRDTNRSYFGMRETIAGGDVVWPVWKTANISLVGEANERSVDLRAGVDKSSPSIETLYTEATAPGLTRPGSFTQTGEGVRLRPEFAGGYVQLNYLVKFQQYASHGDSQLSFQRLTLDFSHQFVLHLATRPTFGMDSNGPNDCGDDTAAHACPAVSNNREGSIGLRFLMNQSFIPEGHVVPFYFQPTLGGSDINGNASLGSYQDYRFRGANTMLMRASFEHSIYGPLGFLAMFDSGKVAAKRSDLDFSERN
ncbi:MAG: hypothetical protein ABI824_04775 [Acidobacteriota bacterium]